MGLLHNFSRFLFGRETAAAPSAPTQAEGASAPRRGYSYSDLFVATSPSLCIATVFRCVKLLSDSVAQLPCLYMRLRDGIYVPDTNSRLHYLLTVQPSEAMSAYDFWAQVVVNMLMKGNAYIVPIYAPTDTGLEIARLILTDCVSRDDVTGSYIVSDTEQGVVGTFPEREIVHIKGMCHNNQFNGVSVLTYARMTLDTAHAGDTETKKRFATGGIVRGIVSNDKSVRGFGEYQDKELAKTADNLDERFNVNGENIVALPGMVSYNGLSMTSADMQFLESRKFTVREICRFFGVHPSFVFDDTSNNYKSAEMANVAFLSNTLNPILRKIEVELLRKLVSPSLATKRRFCFDRGELMACDLDSRVKYQTATIAAGIYTVNEWRQRENRPLVDGGDKVMVSANLKDINESEQRTVNSEQQKSNSDEEQE